MEVFGCCSSFMACSDSGKCLHARATDYEGCKYRKKLEAGVVFFGRNAGRKPVAVAPPARRKPEGAWTEVYLHCYKRFLGVWARNHRGLYSDMLTPGQVAQLTQVFDEMEVPYERELLDFATCGTDYPTVDDPAPANSRVVVEVAGVEYHVLNYNACLIKERMADGIAKAFREKGIAARVEKVGKYAAVERVTLDAGGTEPEPGMNGAAAGRHFDREDRDGQKPVPAKEPVLPRQWEPAPAKYKQVTMFEYMRSLAG